MIEFVTLLLGLVAGPRTVELAVRPPVVAIELRLDGEVVGRVDEPPWRLGIDLGSELAPHLLTAVGLDQGGSEVARSAQWVNVPRGSEEARWILEAGEEGWPRSARLAWTSVRAVRPVQVRVTFDGAEIPLGDEDRVALPEYGREQIHLLAAELLFPDRDAIRAESVFGGRFGEGVSTELTAVPVAADEGERLPDRAELERAFVGPGGSPLETVSIEASEADVVVVTDEASRLAARDKVLGVEIRLRVRLGSSATDLLPLGDQNRVAFVWPVLSQSRIGSGPVLEPGLFPRQSSRGGAGADLAELLAEATAPAARQRVADAVASAGVSAATRNRPRMVVLIVDPATPDGSAFTPREVRDYLARLHVPLEVWTFAEDPGPLAERWGEVAPVREWRKLRAAVSHLRDSLERQEIVWLRGSHLPQSIRLAEGVRGFRVAGAD
jgi:hypothetical protein